MKERRREKGREEKEEEEERYEDYLCMELLCGWLCICMELVWKCLYRYL